MQIGTVKTLDFVGGTIIGCLPTEQAAKASAGVLLGRLFNGLAERDISFKSLRQELAPSASLQRGY